MQLLETHKVLKELKPIRLQEYAVGIFNTIPTKSGIKKQLKKQLVLVDGKPATSALFIKGGEKIELYQVEETALFKRLDFPLAIIFEDEYLAIIKKPAGILVSGNSFKTIDNALFQNIKKSTKIDAVRPRPVHRLDYLTSGLLVIGKTAAAIISLNKLFENKEIVKTYHVITIGEMAKKGTITLPVDEKTATTAFVVLKTVISERFGFLNLVELHPKTGRKHQLRKHLLAIGNPVLGDKEYFKAGKILQGKGMFLHASSLEFIHPFNKEHLFFSTELPKKFKKIFSEGS